MVWDMSMGQANLTKVQYVTFSTAKADSVVETLDDIFVDAEMTRWDFHEGISLYKLDEKTKVRYQLLRGISAVRNDIKLADTSSPVDSD